MKIVRESLSRAKAYSFCIILLGMILFTGCSNNGEVEMEDPLKEYDDQQEVVALVNDEELTMKDLTIRLENQQFSKRFLSELQEKTGRSFSSSEEEFLQHLGKSESELTDSEKQYYERLKRTGPMVIPDANHLFNYVLRQFIYEQEALYHNVRISEENALNLIHQQQQDQDQINLGDGGADESLYQESIDIRNDIAEEFGYSDYYDYLETQIRLVSRDMSVQSLRERFERQLEHNHIVEREDQSFERQIYTDNLWEDYGEFLIKRSDIEVLHEDFSVEFYGEDWELSF